MLLVLTRNILVKLVFTLPLFLIVSLKNGSFTLCLSYLQGMFILRLICQISQEKFESQL